MRSTASWIGRFGRATLRGYLLPVLTAALAVALAPGPAAAAASPAWAGLTAPTAGLNPPVGTPTDDGALLTRVACPAAGSCVAVGHYVDSSSHLQGLIETLANGSWTAIPAPAAGLNPAPAADPQIRLLGLACPAPGTCAAVGEYVDSSGNEDGVIETLANGSWTAATAPTPPAAGSTVRLSAVSCPAAGSCVAAGGYQDSGHIWHGLIETLANTTWTAATLPDSGLSPAAIGVVLDFVSCAAAGSCAVAGNYTTAVNGRQQLLATLDSGTWTAVTAPLAGLNPTPAANPLVNLSSLSCPAAGSCVAVGSYVASGSITDALIESLANGSWTAAVAPTGGLSPAPYFGQAQNISLAAVSCPAAGSCVAAGRYHVAGSSDWNAFTETLAGGSWSAATVPPAGLAPAAQAVSPTAISCPAVGSCAITGTYQDVSGIEHGLLAAETGGGWSAVTAPTSGLEPPPVYSSDPTQPPYLEPVTLGALTCPASGRCIAVGYYFDPDKSLHGLIETLSTAAVPPPGYWLTTSAGNVYNFHAPSYAAPPTTNVAGIAADGPGYLLATTGGQVVNVNAPAFGSPPATGSAPVVGIATDRATGGYWLADRAGGVYAVNAPFYGSKQGHKLPAPVVGVTADGAGYLLATRAGNVYAFHAPFYGSKAGHTLPAPVVGIAADPTTGGYWLVTSAGNVYAFHAPFYGSKAGHKLPAPVVGITADGAGYLLATRAGNVYAFGTPFYGSLAGTNLPAPVTGVTEAG